MTTPTKALLQQALDALKLTRHYCGSTYTCSKVIDPVVAALQAAIDAPEPEPVAHVEIKHMVGVRFHANCEYGCALNDGDKLYFHPPAAREPLTDVEIDDIQFKYQDTALGFEWLGFARAIEAKVRGC